MFTVKCVQCSALISRVDVNNSASKVVTFQSPPVKYIVFYIVKEERVLWTLQSVRCEADYASILHLYSTDISHYAVAYFSSTPSLCLLQWLFVLSTLIIYSICSIFIF